MDFLLFFDISITHCVELIMLSDMMINPSSLDVDTPCLLIVQVVGKYRHATATCQQIIP